MRFETHIPLRPSPAPDERDRPRAVDAEVQAADLPEPRRDLRRAERGPPDGQEDGVYAQNPEQTCSEREHLKGRM